MDGARLRRLRELKRKTQDEVAEETGIPQSTISGYERYEGGTKARVSKIYVKSLADYYGVTARYLMGETDNPEYDVNGENGERVRQQIVEIVDALPPSLHQSFVEHGRSLIRFAQEQERARGETGARTDGEPSS
jgi:transcriptional regulator with XRE-family HTH domain